MSKKLNLKPNSTLLNYLKIFSMILLVSLIVLVIFKNEKISGLYRIKYLIQLALPILIGMFILIRRNRY